ncbi:hypothetical protein GCM10007901_09370 [Dyella acidisoli]|uniref:DUF2946 domain-containing protein n=1 Tax=Dyella acidisoli TaxID=1867834 RepID=A0ABQ5XN42_9GAMM|nr:hypothetical protein GCM10007901_09370 [Dyella acidisoli]
MKLSNIRQSYVASRAMKRSYLPLLPRLRRSRGLWVLAVAVLLFKVITTSICFADPSASSSVWKHTSVTQVSSMKASVPDDGDCLLGEAGGCHCTCAHNLPVPAGPAWPVLPQSLAFTPEASFIGIVPNPARSLLRPPIAA